MIIMSDMTSWLVMCTIHFRKLRFIAVMLPNFLQGLVKVMNVVCYVHDQHASMIRLYIYVCHIYESHAYKYYYDRI